MKKTVIICDHPSFDTSIVNRRWLDEVKKYPEEFLIHNLQSSYPRLSIDKAKEHSILENNGTVVLQFPIYWFNSPPFMKQWIDTVFSLNWAYGNEYKLKGKNFALAVTCGGTQEDYSKDGAQGHTIEEFLNSYIQSFKYVKAEYKGCFVFYGAQPNMADTTPTAVSARNYVDFLRSIAS